MPRARHAGSTLVLVVSLTLVVVMIGIAIIALMATMGGNAELQNAVDSGALTIGRRCLTDISVLADTSSAGFFDDVANHKHEVNLENLNYCLAKAMLVEINQTAMAYEGESTDQSGRDSSNIFQNAKSVSEHLDTALNDFPKLKNMYGMAAYANSLRMLGNRRAELQQPLQRAYVDRGEKSSVYFDPDGLPLGFNAASLKPIKAENKTWLPGYVPLDVGARGFNFVPQPSRPPHLVLLSVFNQSIPKPQVHGTDMTADYLPVVANSYKCVGDSGAKLQAVACVEADSVRDGLVMEMPHAFLTLSQLKPNFQMKAHENIPISGSGNWGPERPFMPPAEQEKIAKCFREIKPQLEKLPTPWQLFHSKLYAQQLSGLKNKFLQRTKEILPFADPQKFQPPFQEAKLTEGETLDCFRSSNKIHLHKQTEYSDIASKAPWLPPRENESPDGQTGRNDSVTITRTNYLFQLPCPKTVAVGCKIESQYTFQWQPGTGANGALGRLVMSRNVTCRFLLPTEPPSGRYFHDDPPAE